MMKLSIMLVGLLAYGVSHADELTDRGLALALAMDRAESGYGDYTATVTMHLFGRGGTESIRELRFRTLETENDGDKSIVVFDRPKDVAGFAALTHAHKRGTDDQWMYLPDLRRVKRIASDNQAGPFVGSEFAYEDIGSQEPEQYTYRHLGDAKHDGHACFELERIPVNRNSGYSRHVVLIDQERHIPLRIDYYDRKGELLKTLNYSGYQIYLNRIWRPDRAEMVNHQIGKRTVVEYSDYRFATGLTEQDVSVDALKRLR